MAIASMTGFARKEGAIAGFSWTWELKSVNGRNLDIRCRLPGGYDALESVARSAAYGPRPRPLAPRSTEAEREIHAAFIRDAVKDDTLWIRFGL